MNENGVAKTLRIIGIAVAVCGLLGAVYIYANADLLRIAVIVAVSSFVAGMLFIGFAEVIFLLQESVDKQNEIIKKQNQIMFENHRDNLM